jgi:hypothetical protein
VPVSAWNGGGDTYGIYIGVPNRNRYFKHHWPSVIIEIDGQPHTFALTAGFWRHCPEIRDRGQPFIRDWLRRHRSLNWPRGRPPTMELVAVSDRRFRLVA